MKKILSLLLITLFSASVFAQSDDKQNIKVVVNRQPSYPLGEQVLYDFVSDNTQYSKESKDSYVEGSIMLSFDVMPDSSLTNVLILSDLGYGIGEAVVKLVKTLKFSPGLQLGKPTAMSVVMTFPVRAH